MGEEVLNPSLLSMWCISELGSNASNNCIFLYTYTKSWDFQSQIPSMSSDLALKCREGDCSEMCIEWVHLTQTVHLDGLIDYNLNAGNFSCVQDATTHTWDDRQPVSYWKHLLCHKAYPYPHGKVKHVVWLHPSTLYSVKQEWHYEEPIKNIMALAGSHLNQWQLPLCLHCGLE